VYRCTTVHSPLLPGLTTRPLCKFTIGAVVFLDPLRYPSKDASRPIEDLLKRIEDVNLHKELPELAGLKNEIKYKAQPPRQPQKWAVELQCTRSIPSGPAARDGHGGHGGWRKPRRLRQEHHAKDPLAGQVDNRLVWAGVSEGLRVLLSGCGGAVLQVKRCGAKGGGGRFASLIGTTKVARKATTLDWESPRCRPACCVGASLPRARAIFTPTRAHRRPPRHTSALPHPILAFLAPPQRDNGGERKSHRAPHAHTAPPQVRNGGEWREGAWRRARAKTWRAKTWQAILARSASCA